MLVVFVCVCVCVWHFQVLLYCCSVMFVQRRCIQCFVMLLHCIDVCVWCMFLPHVPHVHGPGFSSMSPERRSRAAGSQPGFWHPGPKKTAAGSPFGDGDKCCRFAGIGFLPCPPLGGDNVGQPSPTLS